MKNCKTIGCHIELDPVNQMDFCNKCCKSPAANDETSPVSNLPNAASFLRAGVSHMEDRAATYDSSEGERSMAKTVSMFNILTGHSLTETEGWKFMQCLKMVRSVQGDYKADNYEDGAAYAALAGESHAKEDSLECDYA